MPGPLPLLVFTDLDGTLLDHDTYSFAEALPALDALRRIGAGVVLASSKTAAEIAPLRAEIRLSDWPAIVENGAGVLPAGKVGMPEGADYAGIRAALDTLPGALRAPFTGFGDMSAEEVAQATGLPKEQATLAKRRSFSEPGIWHGDEATREDFLAALARKGVAGRMGGRFLTLSRGATKADRMQEIARELGARRTIALGDAPNDVEMLEAADLGIIVANPAHPPLPVLSSEASGRIRRTARPGPDGWNETILGIVSEL